MKSNDPHSAPNWNALWAGLVIEELVRCGIDTFCMAPGSRSTPLVVAAARHPQTRTVVHIDERGAAFFALGYARGKGRPAVWITTSGTAAAHGLAAVVESDQDGIPLLCITADRPPELRDAGANQAIRQVGLFGGYPRWQMDLPAPSQAVSPAFLLTTVDQAVHRASGPHPGPVHLNMMFREPLAPDGAGVRLPSELAAWKSGREPYTGYTRTTAMDELDGLRRDLVGVTRGLVVAGRARSGEGAVAAQLAESLNWPLLADIGSGQRLGDGTRMRIRHYDLLLAGKEWSGAHRPEAVIQVGYPPVSKRLMTFLADVRPRVYAVWAGGPARLDPQHHVTHRLTGAPTAALATAPTGSAAWLDSWRGADRKAAQAVRPLLDRELSEPAVAAAVAQLIPPGHGLFLSNSMPIRDMDQFAGAGAGAVAGAGAGAVAGVGAGAVAGAGAAPARVGANRGASGIDGIVSTAAGFSDGLGLPVTLLIGDLALLHDLNGLAFLKSRRLVVVAINNDGGGIFSFLPISAHIDVFEPYFGTPHGRRFSSAAQLFDLDYAAPGSLPEFREAYAAALAAGGSTLIEVRTDREKNREIHRELNAAVVAALRS